VRGNGRSICPLYVMGYGRYPVSADVGSTATKRVVRDVSGALPEVTEETQLQARAALTGPSRPDFIARIRTEVRPGARVTRKHVE